MQSQQPNKPNRFGSVWSDLILKVLGSAVLKYNGLVHFRFMKLSVRLDGTERMISPVLDC